MRGLRGDDKGVCNVAGRGYPWAQHQLTCLDRGGAAAAPCRMRQAWRVVPLVFGTSNREAKADREVTGR